jgi:hypothetical protein
VKRAVAILDMSASVDVDVTGTAVRRVSSIIWESADKDPRMCDVVWKNTMVGDADNLHLLGPTDVNATVGPPEILQTDRSVKVYDDTPYHSETLDISCGPSVGLVVDITGSMSQELAAIKAALRAFISSKTEGEHSVLDWYLTTFNDFPGATEYFYQSEPLLARVDLACPRRSGP